MEAFLCRGSAGSDLYLYSHTSEDNAMGFIQTTARICVGFILFSVGIVAALSFARLQVWRSASGNRCGANG